MAPKIIYLVPVLSALALPAAAQTAPAQTNLLLSAEGSVKVEPDEAVAQFNVQADAPNAAAAQAKVNQAMSKALAAAKAMPNVVATTGGYNSYASTPNGQTRPQFTATQSLTLTQPDKGGVPDKAFTDLLGQLQADGLLLNGLSGELSDAGRQSAQRDAIRDALAHLRAEAADIADTLHKKVGALKQLSVNGASAPLPPGPRVMMMKAAAAAPQLAPDKVTISASVSAQIELTSTGN